MIEPQIIYYQLRPAFPRSKSILVNPGWKSSPFRVEPKDSPSRLSILVDSPEWEWRGQLWCHLVSTESLDDLHAFAAALGLHRQWFQNQPAFPHYDITVYKRQKALLLDRLLFVIDPVLLARGPTLFESENPAVNQPGGQSNNDERR